MQIAQRTNVTVPASQGRQQKEAGKPADDAGRVRREGEIRMNRSKGFWVLDPFLFLFWLFIAITKLPIAYVMAVVYGIFTFIDIIEIRRQILINRVIKRMKSR